MANGKTFADMKKPVRQPTPEQIAAFEETGRARVLDPQIGTETRNAVSPDANSAQFAVPTTLRRTDVNTESRKRANAESLEHANTETSLSANLSLREHGNPPSRTFVDAEARMAGNTQTLKAGNTETRVSGVFVRLTIDLDEPVHTRFKTACVMTKRKMVDEVRAFIERRTAELEGEAGRVP